MKPLPEHLEGIDWSLTTWEGSRREQLRRWAATPLAEIITRLEEMERLSVALQEAAPPVALQEAAEGEEEG